jgi:hypothetical protein
LYIIANTFGENIMAIDWRDVRYRGDLADVEELFKIYRIEDYLKTCEQNLRQRDESIRERLLKRGIRLTQSLSPRIYKILEKYVVHCTLILGKRSFVSLIRRLMLLHQLIFRRLEHIHWSVSLLGPLRN